MADNLKGRQIFSYLGILTLAVIFAISFGKASNNNYQQGPASTAAAATVNGKEISMREFNRAYENHRQYMQQMGQNLPDELAKQLGLPRQVLDQLIEQELLAQAAERRGIRTSDEELREQIHKNPDFQKDGTFDLERYRQVLRDYYRKTDVDFETEIRRALSGRKLLDVVAEGATVSDDEVRGKYWRQYDRADVTFVRFSRSAFTSQVGQPTPADLAALKKAKAKEIEAKYKLESYRYHQPESVKARQILLSIPSGATPEKKAELKAKLEEIRKEIEGGKDFAQVAQERSEDAATKAKGGDLGEVERGQLPSGVGDEAFATTEGKMTPVLESPQGFHLVKIEKKNPPRAKELKEVEDEIARELFANTKSEALAKQQAEKALAALKKGQSLSKQFPAPKPNESAEGKPVATESGSFDSTATAIPQMGEAPAVVQEVFAAPGPQVLDKVFPVDDGFAVIEVKSREKPSDEDFKAKRTAVMSTMLRDRQSDMRQTFVKSLRAKAEVRANEELSARPKFPGQS